MFSLDRIINMILVNCRFPTRRDHTSPRFSHPRRNRKSLEQRGGGQPRSLLGDVPSSCSARRQQRGASVTPGPVRQSPPRGCSSSKPLGLLINTKIIKQNTQNPKQRLSGFCLNRTPALAQSLVKLVAPKNFQSHSLNQ